MQTECRGQAYFRAARSYIRECRHFSVYSFMDSRHHFLDSQSYVRQYLPIRQQQPRLSNLIHYHALFIIQFSCLLKATCQPGDCYLPQWKDAAAFASNPNPHRPDLPLFLCALRSISQARLLVDESSHCVIASSKPHLASTRWKYYFSFCSSPFSHLEDHML